VPNLIAISSTVPRYTKWVEPINFYSSYTKVLGTGAAFVLKIIRNSVCIRFGTLDRLSQLIWVDPNVLMYLIRSNIVPQMCLIYVSGSVHHKLDD